MSKQMFKVISPVERRDGSTWWMRCGTGHRNQDESINVYLDALPLGGTAPGKGVTLQLREYSAEELRERSERTERSGRRPVGPNGLPALALDRGSHAPRDGGPVDTVPF